MVVALQNLRNAFNPTRRKRKFWGLANAFRATAQTCGTQQFPAAPVLTWVEAVGDAAWFHSVDMGRSDTENHTGASAIERMKARSFEAGETAENRKKIAGVPGNPSAAFDAWKADPIACANIMNSNFTVMGAGYAGHHDGFTNAFWTQILTTPKSTTPPNLTVNPTTATVTVGGAATAFTATLLNSTDTINWTLIGAGSISNETGATTNYTPPANGDAATAILTAKVGIITASATITINAAAPGLTVTPATAMAMINGPDIIFKASSSQITWSITGPAVVSSSVGDTFTFKPPLDAAVHVITATAITGGQTATATVTTVNLSVSPSTATVAVGGAAIPFNATLVGSTDPITWSLTGPGTISTTTGVTTNYTPPATGDAGTATLTATVGPVTASATITITVLPPGGLQVEIKDLQRQVLVPPFSIHSLGRHLTDRPVAPMAANPNGGAFILWIRQTDNKAFLTQVDGTGNAVGTDQDLGTASVAGAVGTDGTKVAYMLKTGADQLLFKVLGGGQTLLVDNEKAAPWPNGNVFGNEKMRTPVDFRRQAVLPVGGNWFTSFDHSNRFGGGDVHSGMSMVMLDGNGANPTLGVPWGTSHSLDILALFDGENVINVTVGDAFPQDFRLHVLTPQGQVVGERVDLFAKNNFDIGGDTVNNVPGNMSGLSSGKLGGLSNLGGGQFALSYLIQPSDGLAAKVNEIGLLTFDKQGTAKRFKLKDGTGISYVRSARYGANILVAWETTAGKFFATVVDAQGTVVKAEQELIGGATFSERDSFINLANGDVMWSASVGGSLKVFRLPAP